MILTLLNINVPYQATKNRTMTKLSNQITQREHQCDEIKQYQYYTHTFHLFECEKAWTPSIRLNVHIVCSCGNDRDVNASISTVTRINSFSLCFIMSQSFVSHVFFLFLINTTNIIPYQYNHQLQNITSIFLH